MKIIVFLILYIHMAAGVTDIIVSNHPVCTKMAKHYIEASNVTIPELAIIVSVCEGIVNPQYSGLGGGFMAVIYNGYCKQPSSVFLNSREKSPSRYQPNSGKKYGEIGVPSMLKGYEALYRRNVCGMKPKLAWKDLFTENIKLAEKGWDVLPHTKGLLRYLKGVNHSLSITNNNNRMKNPILARTLRIIANEGPSSSLYQANGPLHSQMMSDLNEAESFIDSTDLLAYQVQQKSTLDVKCLNMTISTTKLPGSGATFILGCKIVEAAYSRLKSLSPDRKFMFMYHTLRHMYSLKPYLRLQGLRFQDILANSQAIADDILLNIDHPWEQETIKSFGAYHLNIEPPPHKEEYGTTNIVLKRGKEAITMTSTINYYFGVKLFSKHLGIFYNDQLKDFDAVGTPNGPLPNRTPQSAISGLILSSKRKNPVFQMGAAGGSKMIGSIYNTFFNVFVNEMGLVEANLEPRCTPQYTELQEQVLCEREVRQGIREMFDRIRVRVKYTNVKFGGVTACSTLGNYPRGVYDERRGGDVYIFHESEYTGKKHECNWACRFADIFG